MAVDLLIGGRRDTTNNSMLPDRFDFRFIPLLQARNVCAHRKRFTPPFCRGGFKCFVYLQQISPPSKYIQWGGFRLAGRSKGNPVHRIASRYLFRRGLSLAVFFVMGIYNQIKSNLSDEIHDNTCLAAQFQCCKTGLVCFTFPLPAHLSLSLSASTDRYALRPLCCCLSHHGPQGLCHNEWHRSASHIA